MKKGYISKDQRKKILLLSDDIRTHSGVGTQARQIVLNTAHHFNWINLGGQLGGWSRFYVAASQLRETRLLNSS